MTVSKFGTLFQKKKERQNNTYGAVFYSEEAIKIKEIIMAFSGQWVKNTESLTVHLHFVRDQFHVFLNNFEMAIFLSFFKLFIIFFLHHVSVIFKKREPL